MGELLQPGQVLRGRYRVAALLGTGGMGAVYEVEHLKTQRRLALKVLIPEISNRPDIVERFLTEARAAAALSHPGIVEILDLDSEGGLHFIVMEKLVGEELAARIAREAPLTPTLVANVGAAICEIMAVAHRHVPTIVHRDLKPENVFLARPRGRVDVVKILDFGIAKLIEEKSAGTRLTRTGDVYGTPLYMSPEQLHSSKDVDERTDIYAIGVILYEALTGRTPFRGESFPELVLQINTAPLTPIRQLRPQVPAALARTVEKAMARDRDDRFRTAAELGEQLTRSMAAVDARRPPARPAPARSPASAPAPAAASARLISLVPWAGAWPVAAQRAVGLGGLLLLAFALFTALTQRTKTSRPPVNEATPTALPPPPPLPLPLPLPLPVKAPEQPAAPAPTTKNLRPRRVAKRGAVARAFDYGDFAAVFRGPEHQATIRDCFERGLRRGGGSVGPARLEVSMDINRTGSVESVRVYGPPELRTVSACLESRVRGWRFPANTGRYQASFPLTLSGRAQR